MPSIYRHCLQQSSKNAHTKPKNTPFLLIYAFFCVWINCWHHVCFVTSKNKKNTKKNCFRFGFFESCVRCIKTVCSFSLVFALCSSDSRAVIILRCICTVHPASSRRFNGLLWISASQHQWEGLPANIRRLVCKRLVKHSLHPRGLAGDQTCSSVSPDTMFAQTLAAALEAGHWSCCLRGEYSSLYVCLSGKIFCMFEWSLVYLPLTPIFCVLCASQPVWP